MNLPDSPQALTIKIWIIIGIILTSSALCGIALAEDSDSTTKTKFDVYFSEDNFTNQGPNHNILVLNKGNSTQINVYVKNNDNVPHKIWWSSPTDSNSDTFSTFKFEPNEILVFPNKTNSTKLFLTVSNQTDTHSTFVTFVGQSETFGMKGLGFYVVVDDGFQWVDYSLRAGLPGSAFPRLETGISEEDATKIISNGMSLPKYVPQGYKFRGITDWGDSQQIVYSKFPVSNMTGSMQFWEDDGLMIFYGIDGPNVNNTQRLPSRVAQDEGQEIRINGLLGSATDQTVRTVMYSNSTYKEPASLNLFDDNEKISVSIKGNLPLDDLLQVASSISKIDSNGNNQDMNNHTEIEDKGNYDNEKFSMSPLKQFRSGISLNEVQCNENLVLVQKYDGSPACVKPKTKSKLIERGWTKNLPYISKTEKSIYPSFSNGITQILNPKHEILTYYKTIPVIDDQYLSKNVQQWNDATNNELETQYQKYGDDFYTNLGMLLIKNEIQRWMNKLGIVNEEEDFRVIGGSALTSLPPHIGFSTIIHATDGHYYWFEGSTHANNVSFYKVTQLQYPNPMARIHPSLPSETPPQATIMMKGDNDLKTNPSSIVLHHPKSVEFSNDTPNTLTITVNKEGSSEFSSGDTQLTIPAHSSGTWNFTEPGSYMWRGKAPTTINDKEYVLNTGGVVLVLSDDMSSLSLAEQMEISRTMLITSELPISGLGQKGEDDTLYINLDNAIEELLPESEQYYLQTAQRLIPFDITLVLDN